MPIRVLIADDHSVVRQGLRMFLALDAELEVVGEAPDGRGLAPGTRTQT
jgi:DNA-binding NarL/FixJ family response regulator